MNLRIWLKFNNFLCPPVPGGVTTAHQVPAVSQSAYSPPTPETPDSILSTPPQTILSKSISFPSEHSIPSITSMPPTQPTAKVTLAASLAVFPSQMCANLCLYYSAHVQITQFCNCGVSVKLEIKLKSYINKLVDAISHKNLDERYKRLIQALARWHR